MNCAILTYDGKAFVGFTCDVPATPDSALLPKFLQESFTELKAAVGLKAKKVVKKRAVARKSEPAVVLPKAKPIPVTAAEPVTMMAAVASD